VPKRVHILENSIKRLEEIAELLENNEIPLEESFKIYEESVKIVSSCQESLNKMEQKVIKLAEIK